MSWYLVVRHDGSQHVVEARSHTEAKCKGANWFVFAGAKRYPDVKHCFIHGGRHICVF